MSELLKRSIFGAIYVVLMTWAVLSSSSILFCLIFSVLAFLGIWEYSNLVGLHRTRPMRIILDALVSVFLILAAYAGKKLILGPYLLYLFYITIRSLYSNREEQPLELAKIIFGQCYVTTPLAIMAYIHSISIHTLPFYSPSIFLFLLLTCIWANDTGAYLIGSRFGRRRLFPSLSPKKSWEGFFGGVLFSVLTALLITSTSEFLNRIFDWYLAIFLGVVISILATWGDLFESMLKRNAGVKDSGNIIPGHGGILDRIDSLLFVVPWVTLLALYFLTDKFF